MEGLALADYDLIARGAHDLALASQASSWEVLQTEDYARQSREFRRACESLRAAAKDRNLDGAALAWMEVTLKCIQCHKYVRDVGAGN
jgi:cytochrome c556